MKSPLRYPGGKGRIAKDLVKLFPPEVAFYVEPFLGGGSVACAFKAAHPDKHMVLSDADIELIGFWESLISYNGALIRAAELALKLSHEDLTAFLNKLKRAPYGSLSGPEYYILNQCSFSGATRCGGLPKQYERFTASKVKALEGYHSFLLGSLICQEPYWRTLKRWDRPGAFFFVDPPYINIKNLYKLKEIDHRSLSEDLIKLQGNFLMTINDCEEAREVYKRFFIRPLEFTYSMTNTGKDKAQKTGRELLISNYELST